MTAFIAAIPQNEEEIQALMAQLELQLQRARFALQSTQAANKSKGKQKATEPAPEADMDSDDFDGASDSGSEFADFLAADIVKQGDAAICLEHEGIFLSGNTTHAAMKVSGGHFLDVTFHDCIIEDVKFENCVLVNVDFKDCSLVGFSFFNIVLKNVCFTGSKFFPRGAWRDHKIVYSRPSTHPSKKFEQLITGLGIPKELSDPVWLSEQYRLFGGSTTQYDAQIAAKMQEEENQRYDAETAARLLKALGVEDAGSTGDVTAKDAELAAHTQKDEEESAKPEFVRGWYKGCTYKGSREPGPSKDVKPGPWGPSLTRDSQCRHQDWSADDANWAPKEAKPTVDFDSVDERESFNETLWTMHHKAEEEKKNPALCISPSNSNRSTNPNSSSRSNSSDSTDILTSQRIGGSNGSEISDSSCSTVTSTRQLMDGRPKQASSSKAETEIPHFTLNIQKRSNLTEKKLAQHNKTAPTYGSPSSESEFTLATALKRPVAPAAGPTSVASLAKTATFSETSSLTPPPHVRAALAKSKKALIVEEPIRQRT